MMLYIFIGCSLLDNPSQPITGEPSELIETVKAVENRFTTVKEPDYQNDLLGAFLDETSSYIWSGGFEVCSQSYSTVCSPSHADKPLALEVETPLTGESYSLETFYAGLWMVRYGVYDSLKKLLPFSLFEVPKMRDTERFDTLFQVWFGNALFEPSTENELHRKVRVSSVEKWGPMLPKSSDTWRGTTYQNVYDTLFKDFAHLLSISYVYLQSQNIDDASRAYLDIAANDTSEYGEGPLNHLKAEYMDLFSEVMFPIHRKIEQESSFQNQYYFNPALSIGFWLRRHADGSAPALWNVTLGILQEYDSDWVEHLRTKYPSTAEIFASPKLMTTSNHIFEKRAYVWINTPHRNQSANLWVDGISHGNQQLAVTTPGVHTLMSLDCDSGRTDNADNPLCSCQYVTLEVKAEEVKEIQFTDDTKQWCKSDGTTVSTP